MFWSLWAPLRASWSSTRPAVSKKDGRRRASHAHRVAQRVVWSPARAGCVSLTRVRGAKRGSSAPCLSPRRGPMSVRAVLWQGFPPSAPGPRSQRWHGAWWPRPARQGAPPVGALATASRALTAGGGCGGNNTTLPTGWRSRARSMSGWAGDNSRSPRCSPRYPRRAGRDAVRGRVRKALAGMTGAGASGLPLCLPRGAAGGWAGAG